MYPTYWRDSRENDLAHHLIDEIQLDRIVGNVSDKIADEAVEVVQNMYGI